MVVHLPDEKRLAVDSKVSLTAYERMSSAEDEAEREQALKQHVTSLRSHVKGLSSKNYEQLYGGNSPDFVLMFVPIESAFGVALQQDTSLYDDAFRQEYCDRKPLYAAGHAGNDRQRVEAGISE
ncbi:MAG: DNA recombination protein RmuC [Fodinibius sp.]|nr:DNA recombination protein RmuC [Fodinibius sp.]